MSIAFRSLALSLALFGAAASHAAQAEPSEQQREYADSMILCHAHAQLMQVYAQDKSLNDVPKPVDYTDLAQKVAGKDYVTPRVDSQPVRDQALAQLKELLSSKSYDDLSESERDAHMNATWKKVISVCNEYADKRPAAAAGKASPAKAAGTAKPASSKAAQPRK